MKLAVLLAGLLLYPADWYPLTVGRVTVQFPVAYTRVDSRQLAGLPATARSWTARTPEGMFFLLRTVLPHPVGQQDTSRRQAIYDSINTQALRLSKGRRVRISRFNTTAGFGYETSYRYLNPYLHRPATFFMRNLVVDSANYFLQCIPTDGNDSLGLTCAEQRRRFFNSLTVKP